MLTATKTILNPSQTFMHLPGDTKKQKAARAWVNFSQFVMSTYAISNKYLPTYEVGFVDKPNKGSPGYQWRNKQNLNIKNKKTNTVDFMGPTVLKRALHLCCLASLYALHQYSKNTAYGVIGAMLITKIASNGYAYYHRSDNMNFNGFSNN